MQTVATIVTSMINGRSLMNTSFLEKVLSSGIVSGNI